MIFSGPSLCQLLNLCTRLVRYVFQLVAVIFFTYRPVDWLKISAGLIFQYTTENNLVLKDA